MLTDRGTGPTRAVPEFAPRLSGTAIDRVRTELEPRHAGRREIGRRSCRGRSRTATSCRGGTKDRESHWFHATLPAMRIIFLRAPQSFEEGPRASFPMPRL